MIDVRCKNCGRLLCKANVIVAAIKCHSCRKVFEYKVFTDLHMTNMVDVAETYARIRPESTKASRNATTTPDDGRGSC